MALLLLLLLLLLLIFLLLLCPLLLLYLLLLPHWSAVWLDCCNSLLHVALANTIATLQSVQNNAAGSFSKRQGDPVPDHCCASCIGCQYCRRIDYKLAAMTYKMRSSIVELLHQVTRVCTDINARPMCHYSSNFSLV